MNPILETARLEALRLEREGRLEEAKAAYLAALPLAPDDGRLLTGFAELVLKTGHRSAAITLYRQALAVDPDRPGIPARLVELLIEAEDLEGAQTILDRALRHLAADPGLHRAAASLYSLKGDPVRARSHLAPGYGGLACFAPQTPRRPGETELLVLVSGLHGDTPLDALLAGGGFRVTALAPEFHQGPLPAHEALFNAIADADLCAEGLAAASRLGVDMINPPSRVARTGRQENAARLGALSGVETPKIHRLTRAEAALLTRADLERLAITPPFTLRTPGLHFGRGFEKVERFQDLGAALDQIPGEALLLMPYLDTQSPDGFFRKYRMFGIGGGLFPAHLAISSHWKTHYVTGAMSERPDFREEEHRFLTDWKTTLGPRAVSAIKAIAGVMDLDYFGMDFALLATGEIALFEANPAMRLAAPPADPIFHYRREAAMAAIEAGRGVLRGVAVR